MKSLKTNHWSLSISAAIIVAFSVSIVLAWTGPTATAPNGNIDTPINITATGQVKSGGFWAAAIGSDTGYCIGGSCIIAWPNILWTVSTTTTGIYYIGGTVGIGTISPAATLDINGYAHLATQTSAPFACDALHKGSISLTNIASICICDGSSWILDASGAACAWNVSPGSQNYTTPGTYTFTVPSYNTLIVQAWGGGGGAGHQTISGGQSSWNGSVLANGGNAGNTNNGTGGTASGGDINLTGGDRSGHIGGSSPNGGAGGLAGQDGTAPGGGGGEGPDVHAGGGGGYVKKTYVAGALSVGTSITVIVGTGSPGSNPEGPGNDGSGAPGAVSITWN